jgi:patatin-like phospholipase/acyl hydrolase
MRILAIDGGGIRGIIPALVLTELERRAGRPVADLFDLVAGTSTGGILACALTRPEARPAAELVDIYRTEGPKIFSRTPVRVITSVLGLADEKYDDTALNEALEHYLGDKLLGDAAPKLLLTSYDLEARTPKFFKSWREEDHAVPARIAARATAAAPTYFEPVQLGKMGLVDGGVFANDPAMCAYAEARRIAPDERPYVVSLGTGQQTDPIHYRDAKGWGLVAWVRPLIDVVFDGVADTVDYQLREVVDDGDYARFQIELSKANDAMDDASPGNLAALAQHAEELVASSSDALDQVVGRLTA